MATEIKKMKQGMCYSLKEKTIILNVFKYFKIQFPDKCVTELVRRTAEATGCSEKSVFQFRKEEASVEGLKIPSKTKIRTSINSNSRDIKYDDSIRQAIKNIVYDLRYKNINASLSTILKSIHEDSQLPNFSLMTLRRLLFDMGFCYEKKGTKLLLIEKPPEKQDNGKNKKSSNKTNTHKVPYVKTNRTQKTVNCNSAEPNSHVPIIDNPSNNIPKPTPQHPVQPQRMNNTMGIHHTHMGQSLDYQNHSYPIIPPMQGVQQNHNHPMIGPHIQQPPLSRNVPFLLSHRRNPQYQTPYNMHMRRDDMLVLPLDVPPQCL